MFDTTGTNSNGIIPKLTQLRVVFEPPQCRLATGKIVFPCGIFNAFQSIKVTFVPVSVPMRRANEDLRVKP